MACSKAFAAVPQSLINAIPHLQQIVLSARKGILTYFPKGPDNHGSASDLVAVIVKAKGCLSEFFNERMQCLNEIHACLCYVPIVVYLL